MSLTWRSLVLIGALALGACDTAEERAEKHFKSGIELIEKGELQRALVEFRNVLALDKDHIEARMAYARATRTLGNIPESYASFLRVAENRPKNLEARLALTEIAIIAQNWEEAERHGKALLAAETQYEGSDIPLLALEYRQAILDEDAARARELTRQAEALAVDHPENEILHRILIEGYMNEGEIDKAVDVTNRAIEAAPDAAVFYRVKAMILAQKQDPELLEDHLRVTIARFPDDDDIKGLLVQLLAQEGDVEGATEFLRSEIATAEDPITAHVTLIAFVQQSAGPEAALKEIEAAIPNYEDVRVLQALKSGLLFDQGKQDEAIATLQSVIDASEPSIETDRYNVTLARMLVSTGNEVGARQLVETVLERDPNQVAALKMSATWLIEADKADEAISALRQALDQAPEDAEAMTLMARAHDRNGNAQLAQDLLALAVDASGNAPEESLRFARLLAEQERYTNAEEVLINSLRVVPGDERLLTLLGNIYLNTQDWGRANQVVDTLLRLDSETARQAGNELRLQVISRVDGRDSGIAFLEQMIESEEDNSAAMIALIRARLSQDRQDEAMRLAEQLVADFPDNPRARQVLANTQFAVGEFDAAQENLRQVAESTGEGSDILQYARILGALGKASEAEDAITAGLENSPENPDLLWAKASYLERRNDIDGAIGIYDRLYATNSDSLIIANNLASLMVTYREDEASLERAFTVARRLKGTDVPPFQDTYGWLLFRRGEAAEALIYLEPAAQALIDDPIVQYHLGRVYEDLGRTDDAIAQYEKAVETAGAEDGRDHIADSIARIENLGSEKQE